MGGWGATGDHDNIIIAKWPRQCGPAIESLDPGLRGFGFKAPF